MSVCICVSIIHGSAFFSVTKMADLSQYTLPNETDVCLLDCITAFNGLTEKEKKYAHYLSQASFHGGLICLFQVSLVLHTLYSPASQA